MARTKGAKDKKFRKRRRRLYVSAAIGAGLGGVASVKLWKAANKAGREAAERDIRRGVNRYGTPAPAPKPEDIRVKTRKVKGDPEPEWLKGKNVYEAVKEMEKRGEYYFSNHRGKKMSTFLIDKEADFYGIPGMKWGRKKAKEPEKGGKKKKKKGMSTLNKVRIGVGAAGLGYAAAVLAPTTGLGQKLGRVAKGTARRYREAGAWKGTKQTAKAVKRAFGRGRASIPTPGKMEKLKNIFTQYEREGLRGKLFTDPKSRKRVMKDLRDMKAYMNYTKEAGKRGISAGGYTGEALQNQASNMKRKINRIEMEIRREDYKAYEKGLKREKGAGLGAEQVAALRRQEKAGQGEIKKRYGDIAPNRKETGIAPYRRRTDLEGASEVERALNESEAARRALKRKGGQTAADEARLRQKRRKEYGKRRRKAFGFSASPVFLSDF